MADVHYKAGPYAQRFPRGLDAHIAYLDWEKDFPIIDSYYREAFGISDLLPVYPDDFEHVKTVAYLCNQKIVSLAVIMKVREGELEIGAVSTKPSERRKGCCKAVLRGAIHWISQHGFPAALTTGQDNLPMQKAAESVGMVRSDA